MKSHNEKECNINEKNYDTPPAQDCGHLVMEGPGVKDDGSLVETTNGKVIRKDLGKFGPGMKDGRPLPKAEGKTIRKDSSVVEPKEN